MRETERERNRMGGYMDENRTGAKVWMGLSVQDEIPCVMLGRVRTLSWSSRYDDDCDDDRV